MSADTALQRLLNGLPVYFNTDPIAAPGITVSYSGGTSAIATVHYRTFSTAINGGSGVNLNYNLVNYTLATLVTTINTNTGYTAVLVGVGSTPALSLVEVSNVNILNTAYNLQIFTSLLWQILAPIAWALEDFQYSELDTNLAELCINTSDSGWVDYWGAIYGNLTRNNGETDLQFAQRIMDEAVRPRLTIPALIEAVFLATGITLSITANQADVVKIVGVSRVGQNLFTDRVHARNQFEIFGMPKSYECLMPFFIIKRAGVNPTTLRIQSIINRNKAAGENPVYSYVTPKIYGTFVGVGMFDPPPWPST